MLNHNYFLKKNHSVGDHLHFLFFLEISDNELISVENFSILVIRHISNKEKPKLLGIRQQFLLKLSIKHSKYGVPIVAQWKRI